MEIVNEPDKGKAWTEVDGYIAYVTYRIHNDVLHIPHTYVPPVLEGRGIASELVKHVFDYALSNGLHVTTSCSYVKVWQQRHPEYK